jgi:hypothetical protein
MDGGWTGNTFPLGSSSLSNHGGYLSCYFYYLTMQNPTYMFLWENFEKHMTSILYLNVHRVYKNKKSNGDDQI